MMATYLIRARAHQIALDHIGWCVSQGQSIEDIVEAVGCRINGHSNLKQVTALYSRLWMGMQAT